MSLNYEDRTDFDNANQGFLARLEPGQIKHEDGRFGYLAARDRMAGPLQSLRVWLLHNNATVMAVLLLVIGVTMIDKGIGSF